MPDSFEDLVGQVSASVAERDRAELVVLARSADRETARAEAGDPEHELGATMARFLVRFSEVIGVGRPDAVRNILDNLHVSIDEADARALEQFRRELGP